MKRLNKQQQSEVDDLATRLRTAGEEVTKAVENYNTIAKVGWTPVESAVAAYNALVQEANSFKEQIAADQQSFMDDKSEKWQEGDAGQAYQQWMDSWSEDIEEVSLEAPSEVDQPELEAADTLEGLPQEVE